MSAAQAANQSKATVLGVGLACAAGTGFAAATAAYAAGEVQPRRENSAIGPDGAPPVVAACLPFDAPRDARARLVALLAAALADLFSTTKASYWSRPLPTAVLVPRWAHGDVRASLAWLLPPGWPDVRFVQGATASSLGLLGHAAQAIADGRLPCALVCAVDSHVSAERMDALMLNEAMYCASIPYGIIPGEAAAALLLAPPWPAFAGDALGHVLELRSAVEPQAAPGAVRGRGLAACLRGMAPALTGDPRPGRLLTDLGGPRDRAEAFGFAAAAAGRGLGNLAHLPEAPLLSIGDVGEATGLVLASLALGHAPAAYPDSDVCAVATAIRPAAAVLRRLGR